MRRTASEIIHDLEIRVARLERQAGESVEDALMSILGNPSRAGDKETVYDFTENAGLGVRLFIYNTGKGFSYSIHPVTRSGMGDAQDRGNVKSLRGLVNSIKKHSRSYIALNKDSNVN